MNARLRWTLPFTLAATAALWSGCTIINSHEETRFTGRVVAEENLQRITPGETTEAWVIAALGDPSSIKDVDDTTRILRYESTKIKHTDAELLFIFDVGSRIELDRTVFIETHDGVVARYWREEGHKRS